MSPKEEPCLRLGVNAVKRQSENTPKLCGLGEAPRQTSEGSARLEDDENYKEWRRGIREIERKILGFHKFKDNLYLLERIEANGASRDTIINILALVVSGDSPSTNIFAARKRDELDRLSRALLAVAHQTDRVLSDPWNYASTWFCMAFDPNEKTVKATDPANYKLRTSQDMKRLGNACRVEARKIGFVMRKDAAVKARRGQVTLLGYIRKTTNADFDAEVARLLTIAWEAIGISRHYTAGSLRKIRERYVMPNLDNSTPDFFADLSQ